MEAHAPSLPLRQPRALLTVTLVLILSELVVSRGEHGREAPVTSLLRAPGTAARLRAPAERVHKDWGVLTKWWESPPSRWSHRGGPHRGEWGGVRSQRREEVQAPELQSCGFSRFSYLVPIPPPWPPHSLGAPLTPQPPSPCLSHLSSQLGLPNLPRLPGPLLLP